MKITLDFFPRRPWFENLGIRTQSGLVSSLSLLLCVHLQSMAYSYHCQASKQEHEDRHQNSLHVLNFTNIDNTRASPSRKSGRVGQLPIPGERLLGFFFDQLFAVGGLVGRDYLFGEFVGHVVVVGKLHRIGGAALRLGDQVVGIR